MLLVLNEDFSVGRRIATLIFRSGAWTRKERRAPAADRQGSGRRARAATVLLVVAGTRAQTTESATSAAYKLKFFLAIFRVGARWMSFPDLLLREADKE